MVELAPWLCEDIVRKDMGNDTIRKGDEEGRERTKEEREEAGSKGDKWTEREEFRKRVYRSIKKYICMCVFMCVCVCKI